MAKVLFVGLVTIFFSSHNIALSQNSVGSSDDIEPKALEMKFKDDFSADPRKSSKYLIEGALDWQESSLKLEPLSTLSRKIDGQAWLRVVVDLMPTNADQNRKAEWKLWFEFQNASKCFLRFNYLLQKKVWSIELVDTVDRTGNPVEETVRSFQLKELPSQLDVTYRYGLVEVTVVGKNKTQSFAAYIHNGFDPIKAVAINAIKNSWQLSSLTVYANEVTTSYTSEQRQRLAKAEKTTLEVISLVSDNKDLEAEDKAIAVLKEYKDLVGRIHPSYSASLNNLALICTSLGKYERAKELYLECANITRAILGPNHPAYATTINNLAELYRKTGEYASAEQYYLDAIEIKARVLGKENESYAIGLNDLGILYKSIGKYQRAESLYLRSAEIRKRIHGEINEDYAASLNNLALLYMVMGDHDQASTIFQEALRITEIALSPDHPYCANILNNLASLDSARGEHERAIESNLRALEIRKETLGVNSLPYGESLNNLAINHQSLGQLDIAKEYCQQAIEIRSKAGKTNPDYVVSLMCLAGILEDEGELDEAKELYLEALEIRRTQLHEEHPLYLNSLLGVAGIEFKLGQFELAMARCHKAIGAAIATTKRVMPTLSQAQAFRWIKRYPFRVGMLADGLRRGVPNEMTKENLYRYAWETKSIATRYLAGRRFNAESSESIKEAINELRTAELNLASLVFSKPPASDSKQPTFDQILANASQRKEVAEKKLAAISPVDAHYLAVRDSTHEQLLRQLPQGVAIVDFHLVNKPVLVERHVGNGRKVDDAGLRKVKDLKMQPSYDAFVLRSDSKKISWIELGSADLIDDAVVQLRRQITGNLVNLKTKQTVKKPEEFLKSQLWSKIEPALQGCHTIIVIPDGNLHRVPWSALPGHSPGAFLIQDYAIAVANYGQQLFGLLNDRRIDKGKLLVVGGINYGSSQQVNETVSQPKPLQLLSVNHRSNRRQAKSTWKFLDGSALEAAAIESAWKLRLPVETLSGSKVTENQLASRLEKCRFAHLATHGFFAASDSETIHQINVAGNPSSARGQSTRRFDKTIARNPYLLSGIVVSGANLEPKRDEFGIAVGEDGILTGEEVVGLDLRNLELVTLSACETGLGDVAAGEGVFGLQRAFHQAGARSVIASLWKVDDQATKTLMVEFYKNLWDKKMSKVEALRQAQIFMITNYDLRTGKLRGIGKKSVKVGGKPKYLSPRYWAAFQLSGDWR